MRFAAVHCDFMDRAEAQAASVAAIGAWVRLLVMASHREVDVIEGAKSWTDRQWLASANLTPAEVQDAVAAGLASWTASGGIEVRGFDFDGLHAVMAKRQNGKMGGRPKTARAVESLGNKPIGLGVVNLSQTEAKPNPNPSPLLPLPSLSSPSPSTQTPAGAGAVVVKPRKQRAVYDETPAFATFYEVYPRRAGRAKAAEAWHNKGCEAQAAKIMAALAIQRPAFLRRDMDRVPYPATWLNAGSWHDDPTAHMNGPQIANGFARHALPKSAGNQAALERFLAKGEP